MKNIVLMEYANGDSVQAHAFESLNALKQWFKTEYFFDDFEAQMEVFTQLDEKQFNLRSGEFNAVVYPQYSIHEECKIKEIIADHFGLDMKVICDPDPDNDPDEWGLMNGSIEVLHKNSAWESEKSCGVSDEDLQFGGDKRIGVYRQLNGSDYYFRWL